MVRCSCSCRWLVVGHVRVVHHSVEAAHVEIGTAIRYLSCHCAQEAKAKQNWNCGNWSWKKEKKYCLVEFNIIFFSFNANCFCPKKKCLNVPKSNGNGGLLRGGASYASVVVRLVSCALGGSLRSIQIQFKRNKWRTGSGSCMSISVSALVSEKKQNSNFFYFFFFKFTARNYSAQFLSVCVVAVYLSLIKRFTLSTDHGNLSRDPSKTSCSDTRIRTIYSTNSFDISFGFLVVLGSVGSLVFSFYFCYFFFSCWFNPIRINLELTNFPGISAIWFHSKKNFVWLVFHSNSTRRKQMKDAAHTAALPADQRLVEKSRMLSFVNEWEWPRWLRNVGEPASHPAEGRSSAHLIPPCICNSPVDAVR